MLLQLVNVKCDCRIKKMIFLSIKEAICIKLSYMCKDQSKIILTRYERRTDMRQSIKIHSNYSFFFNFISKLWKCNFYI